MADINVPSWFNAKDYLANKLVQLKAVDPEEQLGIYGKSDQSVGRKWLQG